MSEGFSELLYDIWRGESGDSWLDLDVYEKNRWRAVARYLTKTESVMASRIANDKYRKRYTLRLLKRLEACRGENLTVSNLRNLASALDGSGSTTD